MLPQEEISHASNHDSRVTRLRRPSPSPHRRRAHKGLRNSGYLSLSSSRRASEITRERARERHAGSEETFARAFSKKTLKSLSESLFGFKRAQKSWIQHYGGSELQDGGLKLHTCSLRNSLLFLFLIPPVWPLCFSFYPPVSLTLSLAFYFHHRAVLMVSVRATDWMHMCVCVCVEGGIVCVFAASWKPNWLVITHSLIQGHSRDEKEKERCWEKERESHHLSVTRSEDESMKGNRIYSVWCVKLNSSTFHSMKFPSTHYSKAKLR